MSNISHWDKWVEKELENYNLYTHKYIKKGYLHFDPKIWFPTFKDEFKKFVIYPFKVARHHFHPFIKEIKSTPRIRYDKDKNRRVIQHKERPICYASHKDSLIYGFYSSILESMHSELLIKEQLSENVIAYRELGKCNVHFAKEAFDYVKDKGPCVAIALDIEGFFNSLIHDHLKKSWLEVLNFNNNGVNLIRLPEDHFLLYKTLTRFCYIEKEVLLEALELNPKKLPAKTYRYCSPEEFRGKIKKKKLLETNQNEYGIPQGSPISAVLSNIYMLEFDRNINSLSSKYNIFYRRYCDDILIICDVNAELDIKEIVYQEIKKYKLTIQAEKEDITYFRLDNKGILRGFTAKHEDKYKNLRYLGFEFNGIKSYIRSASLSRYYRRMKARVRESVKAAYGRNSKGNKIFRKRILARYSHLGKRNFITYAHRASKIMDSNEIKHQVSKHMKNITGYMDKRINKKENQLKKAGKFKRSMR